MKKKLTKKLTREFASEWGSKGGKANVAKNGIEHMRRIAKLRWKKEKK